MSILYKAHKFRLYPSSFQKILIHKTFGCVRLIYNHFLDKCIKNRYIRAFDMCNELKELYVDMSFLKEVAPCSLRCAIFNLGDNYRNSFARKVV